tara:strand:+ start:153 stop:689 length:537 start_codon:yes stop_codon:yes gene_type:complete
MSRVGSNPIEVPDGVEVTLSGLDVTVKGPKGVLTRRFDEQVSFRVEDRVVTVSRKNEERTVRALHGLSRALLANMVAGVSTGFSKELRAEGVGYRANLQGKRLELQIGFSHPVHIEAPNGISFEVPDPTRIIVSGIDKQQVGQVAAEIRQVRPPEPYKGKGIRYVGEYVRRKAGKAGV